MERHQDWPTLLSNFISSHHSKEFKYGEHDCCLYACDAVLAMTGVDIAEEFRGYDKDTLPKILKESKGVAGIATKITKKFNLATIPPSFAQRGDLAYLKDASGQAVIGIVSMRGDVYVASELGVVAFPIDQCIRAWRVG